jgi:predicted DNA-binding transcriptional regulator AlpA
MGEAVTEYLREEELDPSEYWMTAAEVCALTGLSRQALQGRRQRGDAPDAYRVGHRTYLFPRSSVAAWALCKGLLDCGATSCRFARERTGQRTNGGCRCPCPWCGRLSSIEGHKRDCERLSEGK